MERLSRKDIKRLRPGMEKELKKALRKLEDAVGEISVIMEDPDTEDVLSRKTYKDAEDRLHQSIQDLSNVL